MQLSSVRAVITGGVSGLGLAVVRAIAVAHHGMAQCRPTERGGSAFEIRWPVHARR